MDKIRKIGLIALIIGIPMLIGGAIILVLSLIITNLPLEYTANNVFLWGSWGFVYPFMSIMMLIVGGIALFIGIDSYRS
jgi:hypothetical protein